MKIRCKFICNTITKRTNWDRTTDNKFTYEAEFSAVTSGSEENKRFFQYTPFGSLKVGMYTQDAFEPGKEYYLDITPVETAGEAYR